MGTTVPQTPGILTRSNLYAQAVTLPKPAGQASSLGTPSTGIQAGNRSSVLNLQAVPVLEANPMTPAKSEIQALKANYQAVTQKAAALEAKLEAKKTEFTKLYEGRDAELEARLAPLKKDLDAANAEVAKIENAQKAEEEKIYSKYTETFAKIDVANADKGSIEISNLKYALVQPEINALYSKYDKPKTAARGVSNRAYDNYKKEKDKAEDEISAKYKPLIAAKDAEIEAVWDEIRAHNKVLESTPSGAYEERQLAVQNLFLNPPFRLKP